MAKNLTTILIICEPDVSIVMTHWSICKNCNYTNSQWQNNRTTILISCKPNISVIVTQQGIYKNSNLKQEFTWQKITRAPILHNSDISVIMTHWGRDVTFTIYKNYGNDFIKHELTHVAKSYHSLHHCCHTDTLGQGQCLHNLKNKQLGTYYKRHYA